MEKVRDFVNRSPWVGWCVAGLTLAVAIYLYIRTPSNESPYSPERMRQTVSIKFTDTGDVVEMQRGDLDRLLRRRGEQVDGSVGIVNPKTNLATGFLYDKGEWDRMIARINEEKAQVKTTTGMNIAPAVRRDIPKVAQPAEAPSTPPGADK